MIDPQRFKTAAMAKEQLVDLDKAGAQLEMLIETVSNLKIEDATETTRIIDSISGSLYRTESAEG